MAAEKKEMASKKEKKYIVSNVNYPDYCGIDAGGVQFAHGKAELTEGRMLEWFKEHEGYSVEEA